MAPSKTRCGRNYLLCWVLVSAVSALRASTGVVPADGLSPGRSSPEELLDLLEARPAWMADAACREAPTGVSWFPERGESGVEAKRVCGGCLVRSECLVWALGQGWELQGIWGGCSYGERRRMLRQGSSGRGGRGPLSATVASSVPGSSGEDPGHPDAASGRPARAKGTGVLSPGVDEPPAA
jgi:WhiB family redox-sensing transcriptional regulator